jgi:hypothetical protein
MDIATDHVWEIVMCSHVIEHTKDPIAFARHLQSPASQYVIVYAPYNETDPIAGHNSPHRRCPAR